ncbi:translation initiation factor SUI1 [Pseudoneurospora amorphoporcata]|uniref:Translation initiation factor SUI1 n=1 Tax=Pseudoneurospora amorphoporcata TaxID=241081 RepID=A0AAN6P1I4_9PEZI|nr:translation initiation factor SUI1 [Pseudoneurospora amorphoporcata]
MTGRAPTPHYFHYLFPSTSSLSIFPLSIPRFSINNSSIHSPPASIYHLKVASAGTFLTKQLRDRLPTTSQPTNTSQRDTTTVVGRCIPAHQQNPFPRYPANFEFMSIENLKTYDPFAEADEEDSGQTKQTQEYIHIRIQQRNGRKTLTTVQGIPKKFDAKKILKVVKKEFACNGTIIGDEDSKMGDVIQLQGDQRAKIKDFLTNKDEGLGLDAKTIKVHGF